MKEKADWDAHAEQEASKVEAFSISENTPKPRVKLPPPSSIVEVVPQNYEDNIEEIKDADDNFNLQPDSQQQQIDADQEPAKEAEPNSEVKKEDGKE